MFRCCRNDYGAYYNGTEWVKTTYNANDYATSNIRAYLTANRTAYRSTNQSDGTLSDGTAAYIANEGSELTPFMEQFNISTSDPVYSKITTRNQSSLYYDMSYEDTSTTTVTQFSFGSTRSLTIDGKAVSISSGASDKFWLPSLYEIYMFYGNKTDIYDSAEIYQSTTLKGEAGSLRLRSPYSSDASSTWTVDIAGDFEDSPVFGACGVRPAFQINV